MKRVPVFGREHAVHSNTLWWQKRRSGIRYSRYRFNFQEFHSMRRHKIEAEGFHNSVKSRIEH